MDIKEHEVYTFKLASSEEVIAKVAGQDEKYIFIVEPLSVSPGPNGMGLMQTIFTSEEGAKVSLNINSITMIVDTADAIKQKYIQTTTGITVPSKKIVMG